MEQKINRQSKRRNKIHNEILNIAAKLIVEKGSQAVSLEEISNEADIARKTLYNHFDNKEAIIKELVLPVCEHAMNYLEKKSDIEEFTLDDIWSYCLELWNNEALNVKMLYHVNVLDFSEINESKHGFIIMFMKLLQRVELFSQYNEKTLLAYADIIYVTYLPLLEALSDQPDNETRFKKAMTGLIRGLM
jgi:AcrR family transcriptional regulator